MYKSEKEIAPGFFVGVNSGGEIYAIQTRDDQWILTVEAAKDLILHLQELLERLGHSKPQVPHD